MSEAIIIKNQRARELKISENTPRYLYFLVLKFQPDRTWFDPFFSVIFQNREINYAPPVYPVVTQAKHELESNAIELGARYVKKWK